MMSPWAAFCFFRVVAEMKYRQRKMLILNATLNLPTLDSSLRS